MAKIPKKGRSSKVMKRAAHLRKQGVKHPLKQAWAEVGAKPCPVSKIKSKGKGKGRGPRGIPFYEKADVSEELFDLVDAELSAEAIQYFRESSTALMKAYAYYENKESEKATTKLRELVRDIKHLIYLIEIDL